MKWRIDDVPVFIAVVENGGMTAAAAALGSPKSTVSTTVARLEQALGLRLIDRDSRNLRVTPEGETFYRQSLLIMEQVREADATVAGLSASPAGRLAAALPPAFTEEILAPRLAEFRARYPLIELDLIVTGHGFELLRDRVDLAVVVGPLQDSDVISRTLIAGTLVWVASPAYLAAHEIGLAIDDIRGHVQICETRYGQARMPVHVDGRAAHIDLAQGITHVNDPLVVRRAVVNGAGVTLLPRHYCGAPLDQGELVEICGHVTFDIAASKLTLVYPHRWLISPRLRAFIDFLVEICA
ncbi:MAG: LysR family transcriptional regulator [Paracoccaceae bacterium]